MSTPARTGPPGSGETVRVEKAVYGGDGLARTGEGQVVLVPFVLPGELVRLPGPAEDAGPEVLEASPHRTAPACVHFRVCGGCQYQMARYDEQLRLKVAILEETLERAGGRELPAIQVTVSPEPYGYRNRIRLRVRVEGETVQLGYSVRGSNRFLPVSMCPIAAPVLWRSAEALLQAAAAGRDEAGWLAAAAEVELLCDDAGQKVQVHLLCPGPVPGKRGSLNRLAETMARLGAPVVSLGASRLHGASGRALELLASYGADGLVYRVEEQGFWLTRGSFFQVNRFLLPATVRLVCEGRAGKLAWDLFAGVGLFARELTRHFAQVTAVEANPRALPELARGLRADRDTARGETTLTFLRAAVLQRERPDWVVLDPPRAGAGEEVCRLLLRLAPAGIVYVSCNPATLARDLSVLAEGYSVAELHMMDLFPQTYHLETVMVLHRRTVEG